MDLTELKTRLSGTIIPVTTPFGADGAVDYAALEELMVFYLANGLRSFIAAGSTGQCYVLSEDEHRKIVETIVSACRSVDDAFVCGACSHTSTATSNRLADICAESGADALLMTAPYYRTHRDMCLIHYRSVARNHDLPLIIYHDQMMPEDLSLWDEVVAEPNIQGVKFATGNIDFGRRIIARYRDRLAVFGGGGMKQFLPLALHGATGYVSSFASFLPVIEEDFWLRLQSGDFSGAARIAELEYDLFDFCGDRSWFSFLVGMINACDLPGRFCREPLPDCTAAEVESFKEFLQQIEEKRQKLTV